MFALWSGLGYYHRARNLHRCAQQIVAQHGGVFPRTADALQTLPGIGRSTAAAIAAFCFGERVAILDGNVRRVLTRVLGFAQDMSLTSSQRVLWDHATELLPQRDPARTMPRYTQGLMDLGATICRTRRPDCLLCPLSAQCIAHRTGTTDKYPVKSPPRARVELHWWLLIARDARGRIWLERRPLAGVWPGLYCPPAFDSLETLERAMSVVGEPNALEALPVLRHAMTHRELLMHPMRLALPAGLPAHVSEADNGEWLVPLQWAERGLPAPIRTLLDALA